MRISRRNYRYHPFQAPRRHWIVRSELPRPNVLYCLALSESKKVEVALQVFGKMADLPSNLSSLLDSSGGQKKFATFMSRREEIVQFALAAFIASENLQHDFLNGASMLDTDLYLLMAFEKVRRNPSVLEVVCKNLVVGEEMQSAVLAQIEVMVDVIRNHLGQPKPESFLGRTENLGGITEKPKDVALTLPHFPEHIGGILVSEFNSFTHPFPIGVGKESMKFYPPEASSTDSLQFPPSRNANYERGMWVKHFGKLIFIPPTNEIEPPKSGFLLPVYKARMQVLEEKSNQFDEKNPRSSFYALGICLAAPLGTCWALAKMTDWKWVGPYLPQGLFDFHYWIQLAISGLLLGFSAICGVALGSYLGSGFVLLRYPAKRQLRRATTLENTRYANVLKIMRIYQRLTRGYCQRIIEISNQMASDPKYKDYFNLEKARALFDSASTTLREIEVVIATYLEDSEKLTNDLKAEVKKIAELEFQCKVYEAWLKGIQDHVAATKGSGLV